ncbi:MAG: class I SAM-dependent methyltransferase [Luteibaculum sp.]
MKQQIVSGWDDYQLLDFGNGRKLERFGDVVVDRPEVNAVRKPYRQAREWQSLTQAKFIGETGKKGIWQGIQPKDWRMKFNIQNHSFLAHLELSPFKHLGVFPEQMENWQFLAEKIQRAPNNPRVLNLFAYTGLASLVSSHFGAEVTHVESIKSTMNWAASNAKLNQITQIRWCLEDAFTFLAREVKRGKQYEGIIMDPPAFGIAAKGKRWKLEEQWPELLANAVKILNPDRFFLVLNTYSPKVDAEELRLFLTNAFKGIKPQSTELCIQSEDGGILKTGELHRISSI